MGIRAGAGRGPAGRAHRRHEARWEWVAVGCAFATVISVLFTAATTTAILHRARTEAGRALAARVQVADDLLDGLSQFEIRRAEMVAADPTIRSPALALLDPAPTPGALLADPATAELRARMQPHVDAFGYLGFFVIDLRGMTRASLRDDNTGTANLIGTDQPDRLQRVIAGETLLMAPQFSDIPLVDGEGTERSDIPTMFVATPLRRDDGAVAAVLAMRIDVERSVLALLRRSDWEDTGEILAVDEDGFLLSDSRFHDELVALGLVAGTSFKRFDLRDPGRELDPSGPPIDSGLRSAWPLSPIAEAVAARGEGVETDGYRSYLGRRVIGAWTWSDDLGYALVAEQEEREALAVARYARNVILILALIGLVTTYVALWYVLWTRPRKASRTSPDRGDPLAHLFDQWSDGVILVDDQDRVVTTNAAARTLFGQQTASDDWDLAFHLPPPGWGDGTVELTHALGLEGLTGDEDDGRRLLRAVRADGSDFPAEVVTAAVEVEGRQLTMHTVRDLDTDLKVVRLGQSLRELERVAAMASRASSGPVHGAETAMLSLRQQLLDLLPDGTLPDGMLRDLDLLETAIADVKAGATHLSHDLSNVSTPLEISPVDLNRVVRTAAAEAAQGRRTHPHIEIGDLPTVQGDHHKLGLLFAGLLNHCIEMAPSGTDSTLTIHSEAPATTDGPHRVVVTGDHRSVGPAEIEKRFEVFRTTGAGDGAGGRVIGLAACRSLAERHGGRLDASFGPDGEPVFVVALPPTPATNPTDRRPGGRAGARSDERGGSVRPVASGHVVG